MTDKPPRPAELVDARGRKPQQRWIAAAERRAAQRRAFESLPEEERAAIYARFDRLLFQEAVWRVARSMPANPHAYCHRRNFKDDEDFRWLITMIREGG